MKVIETSLPGVLRLEPRRFGDDRGFFVELHQQSRYGALGIPPFIQDNFSRSKRGTLRGLHFQQPAPQGKLVTVLRGSVFDVAVDVRRGSPTFSRWVGVELSGENGAQLSIPEGFAHGFLVLSEEADFHYKCTAPYVASGDRCIRWNDPTIGIPWPLAAGQLPLLSKKDAEAPTLAEATVLANPP